MAREIKFRIRLDTKIVGYEKWYKGTRDSDSGEWRAFPQWLYSTDGERWLPDAPRHNEKDRFTGLRDKNGKDVFEGDVILTPRYIMGRIGGNERKAVEFKDGKFGVVGDISYDFISLSDIMQPVEESKKYIPNWGDIYTAYQAPFEVIGNICENPELLS